MRRHGLNVALGAVLLVSLGLNWNLRGPKLERNVEFFPDMARAPRFNAFEPNPSLRDGSTLQPPVEGTIVRGLPPLPPAAGDGAEELKNPFSSDDRAAMERGAVVYHTYCTPCHGTDGTGNGIVVEYGFPRPPTLLRARTRDMTDMQIFRVLTYGRGNMASYAAQVSRDDRWRAVLHVRALQRAQPAP